MDLAKFLEFHKGVILKIASSIRSEKEGKCRDNGLYREQKKTLKNTISDLSGKTKR